MAGGGVIVSAGDSPGSMGVSVDVSGLGFRVGDVGLLARRLDAAGDRLRAAGDRLHAAVTQPLMLSGAGAGPAEGWRWGLMCAVGWADVVVACARRCGEVADGVLRAERAYRDVDADVTGHVRAVLPASPTLSLVGSPRSVVVFPPAGREGAELGVAVGRGVAAAVDPVLAWWDSAAELDVAAGGLATAMDGVVWEGLAGSSAGSAVTALAGTVARSSAAVAALAAGVVAWLDAAVAYSAATDLGLGSLACAEALAVWVAADRALWELAVVWQPAAVSGRDGAATIPSGAIQDASSADAWLPDPVAPNVLQPDDGGGTHVVRRGDTLWRIAAVELGDGRRWREIFDLNRGRRQPDGRRLTNPRLILPGWRLLIPARHPTPPAPASPPPATPTPPPVASVLPRGHEDRRWWDTVGLAASAGVGGAVVGWVAATSRQKRLTRDRPGPPDTDTAAQQATTRQAADSPSAAAPAVGTAQGEPSVCGWASAQAEQVDAPTSGPGSVRGPSRLPPAFELGPVSGGPDLAALADTAGADRRALMAARDSAGRGTDADVGSMRGGGDRPSGRRPHPPAVPRTLLAGLGGPASPAWPAAGLGLDGPGAADAARGLLVAALATTEPASAAEVVIASGTLSTVLGTGPGVLGRQPRLHVTTGLAEALSVLERATLARSRLLDDSDAEDLAALRHRHAAGVPPPILLIADTPTGHDQARVAALLTQGRRLDICGVLLGVWPNGDNVHVGTDGATTPAGTDVHEGQQQFDVGRLPVLDRGQAVDLLRAAVEADSVDTPVHSAAG
ncbi:MAG TPA: hypothetical protein VFW21_15835, partial [Mycobacterium sp.]|nr:hypothetical protein [Mycobacterium sp.]